MISIPHFVKCLRADCLCNIQARASTNTQVIVTSHSPDLLDDHNLSADALLAVTLEDGETRIAALDEASRNAMRGHLFSAGELLRLNQLEPDRTQLDAQARNQGDLFGEDGQ